MATKTEIKSLLKELNYTEAEIKHRFYHIIERR